MKLKFVSVICVLALCTCAFAACEGNSENLSSVAGNETSSAVSENNVQPSEERLVKELNEKEVTQLNFYYVKGTSAAYNGYKPLADFKRYGKLDFFKQINGADEINAFRATLKTEKWQVCDMPGKSVPVMTLYFGNFLILNLEEKQGNNRYFSIYTEEEREYFLVPNEVYDSVLNLYNQK